MKRIAFVTGEEPIENYEAFRNELKKMGIEELIEINQAALRDTTIVNFDTVRSCFH